ncbi:TonB-dependent receptor [Dyadobacter sp. NIV53]|uniref:SusC/RagA family TonB-linked outer membrane protein n=1 Tax=Dyadobacter sp. NIV53 TaxID=2861765 RepID=UPI001E490935|nr:TonB-dependent receptor [Dyadobacter sp. NIV53]
MEKSVRNKPVNWLKIMRIGLFQCVIAALLTSMSYAGESSAQSVLSRDMTLNFNNLSLKEALAQIQEKTEIKFVYSSRISLQDKIDLHVEKQKLSKVLDNLLVPRGISYRVINEQIVLARAKNSSSVFSEIEEKLHQAILPAEVTIKGKVVGSDNNEPLPGVSVVIKGSQKGTSTDANGMFEIDVPGVESTLIFSFVGYIAQEIVAGNQSQINVKLSVDTKSLDEVVVIGYGTMKKGDLSSAVSTVPDMAQIKNRPVLNVGAMIQGKVAGVTAVNNGGHPNSSPKVTIRGVGSRGDESVLYVVDGVPNAPYNPADIESITVLKDAASAAIYGAFSGSAGVILITTRQATEGKPSVEYSGFTGVKNAWRLPQSLNAADEAKVSNLAYTNAGLSPLDGWDITKNPYAQVTRTNWINEIFRTGVVQRHNISINAGTGKFSTLLQGRYEKEEGTLVNTFSQNISLRFNAVYKFTDKIKLRQDVFYNNGDNRGTSTESGYSGTVLSAIYMPRSAAAYYDDGTFGGVGPRDSQYLGIHGDAINPLASLLRNTSTNKNSQMQSVTELSYSDIIPGLTYVTRFTFRQNSNLAKNFTPRRTEPGKPDGQNTLDYSTGRGYNWIWENTANYSKVLGKHNIGAMASMTAQENFGRSFGIAARGFENEADWAQFFINASIFDQNKPWDSETKDRTASYVGRLSYSWADRYFLTGSYRYDIAGRLAEGYRGKGFPAVTAAWKLSSEPFFDISGIDLFKIRGSWGRIGNINSVPLYYGYPALSSNQTYQIGDTSPNSPALYINSRFNPELSWETSQQTDIGLDISLLKQRLTITADYFNKLTFDLIKQQDVEWTSTFGYEAPSINQGKIRNSGFELSASWKDKAGELGYEIGGNFATLKNRVDYIDTNPTSFWTHGDAWRGILTPFRSTVGQPYYSYWLIKNAGIFQTDAAAAEYVSSTGTQIQPNAKAGDLKFVDENGDGKIDDLDRVYMGNAFPKITYGFTTNLTWKGFDASIFFQGVGGVKLFHAFKQSTLNGAEQGYNRWDKILDAWSETNTGSDIPKIRANDPNRNFQTNSDWFLENGNYVRLKNLMIGYTFNKLPKNMNLRIYLSGDNLLTFTKYSGMDPEVGGVGLDGGQYPVSRIYSAGLRLKF